LLDIYLRCDEQILGLDVAMDHVIAVTEFDRLKQLVYVLAYSLRFKPARPLFKHFKEVLLHILKDEIETIFPLKCLLKLYYVLLLEHA